MHKKIGIAICCLGVVTSGVVAFASNNMKPAETAKADTVYVGVNDSCRYKSSDTTHYVTNTFAGNYQIEMNYSGASETTTEGSHVKLAQNGYIENTYALSGVTSISFTCGGEGMRIYICGGDVDANNNRRGYYYYNVTSDLQTVDIFSCNYIRVVNTNSSEKDVAFNITYSRVTANQCYRYSRVKLFSTSYTKYKTTSPSHTFLFDYTAETCVVSGYNTFYYVGIRTPIYDPSTYYYYFGNDRGDLMTIKKLAQNYTQLSSIMQMDL